MATWGLETEIVDLRDLPWDNLAHAGGSVGMLDKCVVEHDGTPWHLDTLPGFIHRECQGKVVSP